MATDQTINLDKNPLSPLELLPAYSATTDSIVVSQSYAQLIAQQSNFNLPVDAGIASKVTLLQKRMKEAALDLNNRLMARYITLITLADNFCILVDSFSKVADGSFVEASESDQARQSIEIAARELSTEAGNVNVKAAALSKVISASNKELTSVSTELDSALTLAYTQLGEDSASLSKEIDDLQLKIDAAIEDIVKGSDKVGDAVKELGVGIITNITEAKSDPEPSSKDKKDATKDTSKDEQQVLDTSYVIKAITAGAEGAAQTSQARADLNRYNNELAKAYQELAAINSSITIAKVVQVQNNLFASSMTKLASNVETIAENWGLSPVIPPGSAISLGFSSYADKITEITTQSDAKLLQSILRMAAVEWETVKEEIDYQRKSLVS